MRRGKREKRQTSSRRQTSSAVSCIMMLLQQHACSGRKRSGSSEMDHGKTRDVDGDSTPTNLHQYSVGNVFCLFGA